MKRPARMGNSETEPPGPSSEEERKPATKHRLRWKLAATLISLVLALGISELILRCLTPLQLGFEYKDGEFTHPQEFVPDETTNSAGFHDVEHARWNLGVRRVVLLGDSYVAARMVQVSQIPGQRLEHYLNERSNQKYEVISIGGGGWGQRQELTAFRRHGMALAPDIVVTLFLSMNDVDNSSDALTRKTLKQRAAHPHNRPGLTSLRADDAPVFFFHGSVLNQLISHRLSYLLCDRSVAGIPVPYFVYAKQEDELWQEAWRETERLILQTKRAAQSCGARYVVVAASTPHGVWGAEEGLQRLEAVYPGMKELEWDLDQPDKRMQQFCAEHDIPFLALEPPFRIETSEGRRLHFHYDGHWNAEGDDLAGQLIVDFLLKLEGARDADRP